MNACVYAICKNEVDNVGSFDESCLKVGIPAFVLDTGSTDGTVDRLKSRGVHVFESKIEPWSFAAARNRALSLVPDSVEWCVVLDLDEVMTEGTKAVLESPALKDFTRIRHGYKPEADAHPDWNIDYSHIHRRHGYIWKWPVHEDFLALPGTEEKIFETREVLIHHHPKPGRRRAYTELLRQAVVDEPYDTRMNLLYARDLNNDGDYVRAGEQLEYVLTAPWFKDPLERSYATCMLAKCYRRKNDIESEVSTLNMAVREMPTRREAYVDLADALRRGKAYEMGLRCIQDALKIKEGSRLPHSDPNAWGFKPLEIAMICNYYCGHKGKAKQLGQEALALARDPKDRKRIEENLAEFD